jgi:hypothetical protein
MLGIVVTLLAMLITVSFALQPGDSQRQAGSRWQTATCRPLNALRRHRLGIGMIEVQARPVERPYARFRHKSYSQTRQSASTRIFRNNLEH